jgi:hypothetical protein
MKKQTAVSIIIENFNLLSDNDFKTWFLNSMEKLEALERNQIIDAVDGYPLENRNLDGEEYYIEIYER